MRVCECAFTKACNHVWAHAFVVEHKATRRGILCVCFIYINSIALPINIFRELLINLLLLNIRLLLLLLLLFLLLLLLLLLLSLLLLLLLLLLLFLLLLLLLLLLLFLLLIINIIIILLLLLLLFLLHLLLLPESLYYSRPVLDTGSSSGGAELFQVFMSAGFWQVETDQQVLHYLFMPTFA